MLFIEIIRHTPVWVWLLFLFIVSRGFKALLENTINPTHLFTLPAIFFIWGCFSIGTQLHDYWNFTLLAMLLGILAGIIIGYAIWNSQPPLKSVANSNLVLRAGTPLNLFLILITFITKFAMITALHLYPTLYASLTYNLWYGLLSGVISGLFLGGALRMFVPWYRNRNIPAEQN